MPNLAIHTMPIRKKVIPLTMAIANSIIKTLRFTETINEAVKWDRAHWNISPGGLLKVFILSTMSDMRVPLSHLEDRLEGIDVEHFLDPEDKSTYVNESNIGEALDRMGKIDFDGIYEKVALSALQQYNIPMTRMHSDTTTISFYGDYDVENLELTEEEKETVLQIERGYNKDGRPECKQVVVGQITNECGIPIKNKILDGSTSDIEWNREAIRYVSELTEAGFKEGVFVADCKVVTEEHVATMNCPEKRVQFVSRCPANFADKLEHRTIAKAYENGQWNAIGPISEFKGATQYKGASFTVELCGAPMRLLVLESTSLRYKAEQAFIKKEKALAPLVKGLEKQQWMCLADAEAERNKFLTMKQLTLFDCDVVIEVKATQKWPRGRRNAETKPQIIHELRT